MLSATDIDQNGHECLLKGTVQYEKQSLEKKTPRGSSLNGLIPTDCLFHSARPSFIAVHKAHSKDGTSPLSPVALLREKHHLREPYELSEAYK